MAEEAAMAAKVETVAADAVNAAPRRCAQTATRSSEVALCPYYLDLAPNHLEIYD